jgi:hypothetical protein
LKINHDLHGPPVPVIVVIGSVLKITSRCVSFCHRVEVHREVIFSAAVIFKIALAVAFILSQNAA